MNKFFVIWLTALLLISCAKNKSVDWSTVKDGIQIENHLSNEYELPQALPLNSEAWEDGIFITRDGLDLYCIYLPVDLISFAKKGGNQKKAKYFLRGNTLDMDVVTNPDNTDNWIHGDIYHSNRTSLTSSFTNWTSVNLAIPVFNEGAPQGVNLLNGDFDLFVYMKQNESPSYDNNLWLQTNVGRDLSETGTLLPTQINSEFNEDNPHIERLSADSLIIFFERENHPENISEFDIWYSISTNNGASWSESENLTVINEFGSLGYEHIQPHLFFDDQTNNWYLYFTTTYSDGKLAIFRSSKGLGWADWGAPEVVLSSGNSLGIGEPTLTSNGDLYFVVVSEHPDGTKYNKYDCDAWMIKKK